MPIPKPLIKQVAIFNAKTISLAEELVNSFLQKHYREAIIDIKISGQGQKSNDDNRSCITILIVYLSEQED